MNSQPKNWRPVLKLAIVHGPNLNWLGKREPWIYGTQSWEALWTRLQTWGKDNKVDLNAFQSNHEGAIIDYLQGCETIVQGVLLNPAALAHTSIALRDCVAALTIPVVEVHLTAIQKRETFRHHSYVAEVAQACITGFGEEGYILGLACLRYLLEWKAR